MSSLVEIKNLFKIYHSNGTEVVALHQVDLSIQQGEFVTLAGPSGSGKTTLLNLMGALDLPSQGVIRIEENDLAQLNKNERAQFRLHKIGFIFQALNLIPVLTAIENVEYVMLLKGIAASPRRKRAVELLQKVGLKKHLHSWPTQMSGGEQQRVAVARALATQPPLVLADEPTANLDSKTGSELICLFRELSEEFKITFVVASHDPVVIENTQRLIRLHDGAICS